MIRADFLLCPRCASPLRTPEADLVCEACHSTYSTRTGAADLRLSTGSIVDSEIPLWQQTLETPQDDWPALVRAHVETATHRDEALSEAVAADRAAWKLLMKLSPDAWVLDLSSGTGLVASHIAPHVSGVVAAGSSLPSLLLSLERFRASNVHDKILPVLTDQNEALPFASAVFDCVLLRAGSAACPPETAPASGETPAQAFQGRLTAARRLLRPDGQLFCVVDNRLSRARWRATIRGVFLRDHRHGGAFPALSYFGYRGSLRKTGFRATRWFSLPGDRSDSHRIQPLRSGSRLFSTDRFGILAAQTGTLPASILETILDRVSGELGGSSRARLEDFAISRKDKVILGVKMASQSLIARIPLTEAAHASERTNARMLQFLDSQERTRNLAPRSLLRRTSEGMPVFVESFLPGTPLSSRLSRMGAGKAGDTARLAMDMVTGPPQSLALHPFSAERFDHAVVSKTASLRRLGVKAEDSARLVGYFRDRLHGASLAFGVVHGDFSPSNILLDEDDNVAGIIDWEGGETEGLSILDAVHYVESASRRTTREHLGVAIPRLARGNFASPFERDFLMERYEAMRIDPRHHEALVYLKWLRQMAHLAERWLAYDQRRIDEICTPVLGAILERC